MKTVYIDVYFLINFTVDLLALNFASVFSKVPITKIRLILTSVFGGIYAIFVLFMPDGIPIFITATLLSMLIIMFVAGYGVRFVRKVKLLISFLIFQTLIGGIVYFAYQFLEKYFDFSQAENQIYNRGILIFAVIILLSIGIIKLLLFLFSGSVSEKFVTVKIELCGESLICSALIDTGNLAKDPIDSLPVILLKQSYAEKLFATGIPQVNMCSVPEKYKRYIRLIPISKI